MMDNLHIWENARSVPDTAIKPITGGRLRGMSDINPVWRQKKLTGLFGPCGIGWKYVITKQWLEPGGGDEIAAFANIELFIKVDGTWSEAIPGTGGSSFVTKEKSGLYTSDECFKMALTDAISVACKALGFGADVYWDKDTTKYSNPQTTTSTTKKEPPKKEPAGQPKGTDTCTEPQRKKIYAITRSLGLESDTVKQMMAEKCSVNSSKELTKKQASDFIEWLGKLENGQETWTPLNTVPFNESEIPFGSKSA